MLPLLASGKAKGRTLAALDMASRFVAGPSMRAPEPWEAVPWEAFVP